MPPIDAGLLSAGTNFLGNVVNTIGQGIQNKKSRRFALEMYNRQNRDNLAFWKLQNQYNSPQQQMMRLQEAGLNPHLVYGGSSGGTAGTAGSLTAPSAQSPRFENTRLGDSIISAGRGAIDNYLSSEIKQTQLDNLKAENDVKHQEVLLKKSQTLNSLTSNARGKFDLKLEQKMLPYTMDARREIVRKMQADTKSTLDANDRAAAMHAPNLKQAMENLLNSRMQRAKTREEINQIHQTVRNLKSTNKLQELEIELKKSGVTYNDHIGFRLLSRLLGDTSVAGNSDYPLLYGSGFNAYKNK